MTFKAIDYLHAKQDLATFSKAKLNTLYTFYKVPNELSRNDKLWYLAICILHTTKRIEFN